MKILAWLVVSCGSALAVGADATDPNQVLSFEMSEEQIPWKESEAQANPRQSPVFAVGLTLAGKTRGGGTSFFPRRNSSNVEHFRSFLNTQDVTELQKAFLERRNAGLAATSHVRIRKDGSSQNEQLLLAVSIKDAKTMAGAYLDYVTKGYANWQASHERTVEVTLERIAKGEARLPLQVAEANNLKTEYDALRAIIHYNGDEETFKAIAALNTMLNTIRVEMSGIRAKIGAIQTHQRNKRINASVQLRLEDMLVEQSIALEAAQARQETATELRDQARRYATLKYAVPDLRKKIRDMERSIRTWKSKVEGLENDLCQATAPYIVDNAATIYPVSIVAGKPSEVEVERP